MWKMGFRAVRSWTLGGLIVAFIELAAAYTLLCISAFAFIPSKVLSLFELYVPCPCSGFFGYQNNDLCFHRLLIDWPISKIITIQNLAKNRFPFDLILFEHQSCNLHVEGVGIRQYRTGIFEVGEDASSDSISGPTWQSSIDKESGCDSKGKKILNQKQKSGIRRRRRAALGYGKNYPGLSSASTSTHSAMTGIPHHRYDGSAMSREFSDSLDPGNGIEDDILGDRITPNSADISESIKHNVQPVRPYKKGKDINKDSITVGKYSCKAEDGLGSVRNDANVIQELEQALKEEKAAGAALYQELEKERSAAATAADEAMAMILRLQEDKASIQMEARQYHRLIEEKFVYDEEEMKILKEILVRREREIHFLEKELEAYEQMSILEDEQAEGDSSYGINDKERACLLSVDSNLSPPPVPQQNENRKSISEKEVETSEKWPSTYDHSQTLAVGKEMMELASDLSSSQALVQKTVSIAGKEAIERDISMISPEMREPQTYGDIGEKVEKDGEHWNHAGSNMHSYMLETESTVYDVHVVDYTARAQDSILLNGSPAMSMAEIEPIVHGSSFSVHNKSLMPAGNSRCKTFNIDLQRRSPSPVDGERLKIDNEVEWLRERLRIIQEEKEKLTFSAEHRERVNAQLKLVEDVVNQLREIQQLREPARHASLPPLSSKANLKKRHHRSGSYEDFGSD